MDCMNLDGCNISNRTAKSLFFSILESACLRQLELWRNFMTLVLGALTNDDNDDEDWISCLPKLRYLRRIFLPQQQQQHQLSPPQQQQTTSQGNSYTAATTAIVTPFLGCLWDSFKGLIFSQSDRTHYWPFRSLANIPLLPNECRLGWLWGCSEGHCPCIESI